jgi:hypothetical protein
VTRRRDGCAANFWKRNSGDGLPTGRFSFVDSTA